MVGCEVVCGIPHPQLRKINCTLQNALVEKIAWWAAMRPLLKVRLRCKASHAEERAAFRSSPAIATAAPTPHPQRRKINCSLQNARAEKAAWWAAGCYAAFRIRTSAKSIAPCRMHLQKKLLKNLHGGAAMCYAGLVPKSLLKVRVGCKAGHALPCEDRQPPQNQLHSRRKISLKICTVGCDVICGVASKVTILRT